MRFSVIYVGLSALLAAAAAHAGVTHFEVVSREPVALNGRVFGPGGTVEKIVGRVTFALDPADRRNAVIVDLAAAPRNAQGLVEAATDVMILRPAHPNGAVLLELPNRGGPLLMRWFDDAGGGMFPELPPGAPGPARQPPPAANPSAPRGFGINTADDAGNGFLLERGFTLVWVGWQGDVRGAGMGFTAPVAPGLTGTSRDMWTFNDARTTESVTLSYAAAEPYHAKLTVRDAPDAPAQTPEGLTCRFIDSRHVEIARPAGAKRGAVYELTYTARDPAVMGMGFAAVRDVASFLRFDTTAENPVAHNGQTGITRSIATGISQSGRALRDMLYFGFNEDEKGRKVFDGMLPLIPGARRTFTNARFAQPGRNPQPMSDRLYPADQFPFTYSTQTDPLTGKRDGLLVRCTATKTCPLIIEMDSEYEFWGSHAALNVESQGKPLSVPQNVRFFMIDGAQHGSSADATSRPSPGCVMPSSPVRSTPLLRAMAMNLNAWVDKRTPPPASRYPSVTDGTLVALKDAYPAIPQLPYKQQIGKAFWIDQTDDGPVVRGEYQLMVPKAGPDGNALGGVRLPLIAVPRGTYVGWNPQVNSTSTEGLCTQAGGALPFAATRADRLAASDPRPSIEELYPATDVYVDSVRKAADRLVADRLMLKPDADAAVEAARQNKLAKLAPSANNSSAGQASQ